MLQSIGNNNLDRERNTNMKREKFYTNNNVFPFRKYSFEVHHPFRSKSVFCRSSFADEHHHEVSTFSDATLRATR